MVMKNTLAVWLCAMMLFQSSAYARSYEVREDRARNGGWSLPTSPVWTPSDFGVQHISLSGMLHVGNKPTIVTLLTFLKASLAANNTVVGLCCLFAMVNSLNKQHHPTQIWHGRVTAYDPTTISLEMGRYAHHTSPNDIIFGTKPTFMLQEAVMGVQHKRGGNHNHTHVLELVQPLRWGMQDDHREGEPWVLRGHTPLTQHLEYCFCVNDWPYTALITEEMMELPPYIEPHSVCGAIHITSYMYILIVHHHYFTPTPGYPHCVCSCEAIVYVQARRSHQGDLLLCRKLCSAWLQQHHPV